MVVIDTSALLFWTIDNQNRLSRTASAAIEGAERIIVSSISIWEIGVKVNKGRLYIPVSVHEFAHRLLRIDAVEVIPVGIETWLKSVELQWEHRDPADRVIVATAALRDCPLITSDKTIRAYYPQTVW